MREVLAAVLVHRPKIIFRLLSVARKGTASIFNMLLIEGTTYPLNSTLVTALMFFAYSLGTDLAFGRCLGMMLAGTHWEGDPTWLQKTAYSTSYSLCFALAASGWLLFLLIGTAQIVSVLVTGRTTHGLVARMGSARLAST